VTVVLQHALAGGTAAGAASAYGDAFRWALGAAVLAVLPAALLIRVEARPGGGATRAADEGSGSRVPPAAGPDADLHPVP
jgi:hypothetical protein